jgi:hypothetical protein
VSSGNSPDGRRIHPAFGVVEDRVAFDNSSIPSLAACSRRLMRVPSFDPAPTERADETPSVRGTGSRRVTLTLAPASCSALAMRLVRWLAAGCAKQPTMAIRGTGTERGCSAISGMARALVVTMRPRAIS